jgi:uncharacterized lipoprotein YajG
MVLHLKKFDYDRANRRVVMKKLFALAAVIALVGCAEKNR